MKVWQNPGETELAEWLWLGGLADEDHLWDLNGGIWCRYKQWGGGHFVIRVERVSGAEPAEAYEASARWINTLKLTLPERRRILAGGHQEEDLLVEAIRMGLGWPVGVADWGSVSGARVAVRKLVDEFEAAGVVPHETTPESARVHHRRWAELEKQDKVSYGAGFFVGARKGDITGEDRSEVFLAGWEHGWEYSMGRAVAPSWYVDRS